MAPNFLYPGNLQIINFACSAQVLYICFSDNTEFTYPEIVIR
jgi:hypothetical protein